MKTNNIKKNTLTNNFIQSLQSEILLIIITTISGIVLARILGPADRGEYLSVTLWGSLLIWYLHLNIYQTVIFYWKRLEKERDRHDLLMTLTVIALFLGLLAFTITQLIILPYVLTGLTASTVIIAKIYFTGMIFSIVTDLILGALAAQERFFYFNLIRIINPLMTTISILLLGFYDILNVFNALLMLFVINLIISLSTIVYGFRQNLFKGRFNKKMLYTLWYGAKAQGGSIAEATSGNATQMILSVMLPTAALGFYSTSLSSVKPVATISNALGRVSFPTVIGISKENIHNKTMNLWRKNLLLNISTIVPFGVMLPYLIPLVYGNDYINSIIPAIILLLYTIFNGQCIPLRNAINGSGKTFVNTTTEIVSALFIIISLSLFVKLTGVIGASLIMVIATFIKLIIFYLEYNKHISKIHFFELIPTFRDFKDLASIFNEKFSKSSKIKRNVS